MGSLFTSEPTPLQRKCAEDQQRPFFVTPRGREAYLKLSLPGAACQLLAVFVEGPLTYEEGRAEIETAYAEYRASRNPDATTLADLATCARCYHLLLHRLFHQGFLTKTQAEAEPLLSAELSKRI